MASYLIAVVVVTPALAAIVASLIALTQRNTPPSVNVQKANTDDFDEVNDVGFLRRLKAR